MASDKPSAEERAERIMASLHEHVVLDDGARPWLHEAIVRAIDAAVRVERRDLAEAMDIIDALLDQQAMPDDSLDARVASLRDRIRTRTNGGDHE